MYYKQETRLRFENSRLLSKLSVLIEDLHLIGHSRYLYYAAMARAFRTYCCRWFQSTRFQ